MKDDQGPAIHLAGLGKIAAVFHVSQRTARSWIRQGAPCLLIGRRWQASYPLLWEWLLAKFSKPPD